MAASMADLQATVGRLTLTGRGVIVVVVRFASADMVAEGREVAMVAVVAAETVAVAEGDKVPSAIAVVMLVTWRESVSLPRQVAEKGHLLQYSAIVVVRRDI